MWESRHGFPTAKRQSSGHRRYSQRDVELVRQVAAQRAAGVELQIAIQRVLHDMQAPARSLYATLRRCHPQLEPCRLPKRTLIALSHAIEDESLARADSPLLFAFFQRQTHYRHAQARWHELARTARLAIAFADFERPSFRMTARSSCASASATRSRESGRSSATHPATPSASPDGSRPPARAPLTASASSKSSGASNPPSSAKPLASAPTSSPLASLR